MIVHYYGWSGGFFVDYQVFPYAGDWRDYATYIVSSWMIPGTVDPQS
jgi:hypothetical protein